MVHLKLSTEQFKSLISDIVNEINEVQHGSSTLTFNDPTTDRDRCEAIISQNWGGVFYLTYMDVLKASSPKSEKMSSTLSRQGPNGANRQSWTQKFRF